jgi:hypothetical protein
MQLDHRVSGLYRLGRVNYDLKIILTGLGSEGSQAYPGQEDREKPVLREE